MDQMIEYQDVSCGGRKIERQIILAQDLLQWKILILVFISDLFLITNLDSGRATPQCNNVTE
jgi:hypothetical protein